jgi:AraC family transcriptional regulator
MSFVMVCPSASTRAAFVHESSAKCHPGLHRAKKDREPEAVLESDESVKSISYSMGFSSPASFCYAFRRATSETPSEYRRRVWGAK